MSDEYYMQIALEQAQIAAAQNEIPVGAVLVDEDGFIITKNHNMIETFNDFGLKLEDKKETLTDAIEKRIQKE